ncbi:MAG: sigma-70 family RNA polymerase sigma factor [Verrucomicrobia bacterium]|nr:sigma-70 family RNA polymerase sigma factor [Verrucomicrobiota bacterium]
MSRKEEYLSLIKRLRVSDEAAAKELVQLLYPLVIRIVRKHLPRREQEEDLAQEVFLKVFTKIGQYQANMPFEHWVSRVAINTCIDHLRKQRNRPEYRWSDFSEEQQAMLENSVDTSAIPAERSPEEIKELLYRLLTALKPHERLIVQLLYIDEKSVMDICDLTGWKSSKVKVVAFRARRKLTALAKKIEE